VQNALVAKVRGLFEGTGLFGAFAIVSWVAGFAMFVSILLSAGGVQWWLDVHSVQGHEQGGLAIYTVGGKSYAADDINSYRTGPVTVYYIPSDPSKGSVHNTKQVLDWAVTGGPGALGAALLSFGLLRRGRQRRKEAGADPNENFGHGIPDETMNALLERNRGPR
jgi:hypothetical protein